MTHPNTSGEQQSPYPLGEPYTLEELERRRDLGLETEPEAGPSVPAPRVSPEVTDPAGDQAAVPPESGSWPAPGKAPVPADPYVATGYEAPAEPPVAASQPGAFSFFGSPSASAAEASASDSAPEPAEPAGAKPEASATEPEPAASVAAVPERADDQAILDSSEDAAPEEPAYGRGYVQQPATDPNAPTEVNPVWLAAHRAKAAAAVAAAAEPDAEGAEVAPAAPAYPPAVGRASIPESSELATADGNDDRAAGKWPQEDLTSDDRNLEDRKATQEAADDAERQHERDLEAGQGLDSAGDEPDTEEIKSPARTAATVLSGAALLGSIDVARRLSVRAELRHEQGGPWKYWRPSNIARDLAVRLRYSDTAKRLQETRLWNRQRGERALLDVVLVGGLGYLAFRAYGAVKGYMSPHNPSTPVPEAQGGGATPEVIPSQSSSSGELIPPTSGGQTGGTEVGIGGGTGDPRVDHVEDLGHSGKGDQGTLWGKTEDMEAKTGIHLTPGQEVQVTHNMADLSGVDYNNADHLPDDFQVKMPTDSVFKQWAAAAGATVSSAFVFTRRGARRLKDFVLVAEANPNR